MGTFFLMNVSTVALPSLGYVDDYVYFSRNTSLSSIDLGSLVNVGTQMSFYHNIYLANLAMGAIRSVGLFASNDPLEGVPGHTSFHGNLSLPAA